MRRRRALSHLGGRIQSAGDRADAEIAAAALDVSSDEQEVMAHVHGFHSYPARLHPVTAARLVEGLSRRGGRVLDPFCGSGTVLVEARISERRAFGIDANPLAVELAWLKTLAPSEAFTEALGAEAARIAERAEERRTARSGPTRRYARTDRELFDVHVLLELDGLRAGIERIADAELGRALRLVLSSLLTKLSRQPGDTAQRPSRQRLAAGFAIRSFTAKAGELARRLREYTALLAEGAPPVRLRVGDARRLGRLTPFDLIVTSPPYPGVYDYLEQHRTRLRWLGLDAGRFARAEIGARRELSQLPYAEALARWERELHACLSEMRRVLVPRGAVALVIADSALGGRAVYADRLVERLAAATAFRVAARARQPRPHFHRAAERAFRERERAEHVLILRAG